MILNQLTGMYCFYSCLTYNAECKYFQFVLQDGVCSYSVTATSTDGEPLFTDNKFPSLAGESTVSISLQLPTSEEYYITVSACNALGCGPPSSPLTISK